MVNVLWQREVEHSKCYGFEILYFVLGPTPFRYSVGAAESFPDSKAAGAVELIIRLHLVLIQINFHSSIHLYH